MISASGARQQSDEKQTDVLIKKIEKAIKQATSKGEYFVVLENTSLKSISNDTLEQLKELGYTLTEYKTHYYTDSVDNVKISW